MVTIITAVFLVTYGLIALFCVDEILSKKNCNGEV